MTALEWIRKFESYLTLIKNRSVNTVRSYVRDAELLYRFVTTGEFGEPRVKTALVKALSTGPPSQKTPPPVRAQSKGKWRDRPNRFTEDLRAPAVL